MAGASRITVIRVLTPGPPGPSGGGGTGDMLRANNLSDVIDKPASVFNIGLDDIYLRPLGTGGAADFDQISAAFATLTSRGRGDLRLSGGVFNVNQHLTLTTGLKIIGAGFGTTNVSASQPVTGRTQLFWTGPDGDTGTLLTVKASTVGQFIWGFYLDGIAFLGNNQIAKLVNISSSKHSRIGIAWMERCTAVCLQWDDSNTPAGATAYCGWDWLAGTAGTNAACINMDGAQILSRGGIGMTHMYTGMTSFATQQGDGVVVGDCDESDFKEVSGGASGIGRTLVFCGTGTDLVTGLTTKGTTLAQSRPARKCTIIKGHGVIYAERNSRNSISSAINSESSKVIIRPGATLDYAVIDRNTGQTWKHYRYPAKDRIYLPITAGIALTGTPAIGLDTNSGSIAGIKFDAGTTERWRFMVGHGRLFSGSFGIRYSRIVGLQFMAIKDVAAGAGSVMLEFRIDAKGDVDGPGGTITRTETLSHTVDADTTQTFELINYTFIDPVNMGELTGFFLDIGRLGGDVLDTFPADWNVVGDVTVSYVNDLAPSDNANMTITGITKANPAVVTLSAAHDFINGELVRIKSVVGMTQVNNKIFTVTGVTTGGQTILSLAGIDSTAYTDYASGGTLEPVNRFQISDDVIS